MKLPFTKMFEKKEKPEYYLAFILRHEKAIAVIFEQLGTEAKVVGEGEEYFRTNIEDANFEELLSTSDKAISKAETNVPKDLESLKTLFGLKEGWIEQDKIKREYLEKLKKISDELGLSPIGFITITEAIIGLLKKDEGVPITAILAEIGKNYVSVSLIKAGKIVETKSLDIHENPAFTVDILLKHLEVPDVLPSKIIIYNGESEDLSQQFISHQWSKSLPFLHLPQILNLPQGFDAKAILQGAATKMGFEIVSQEILNKINTDEEIPSFTRAEIEEEEEDKKIENKEKEEIEKEINFIENGDSIEKFGFFEEEDIVKDLSPKEKNGEKIKEEKKEKEDEVKLEEAFREGLIEKKEEDKKIEYEEIEEIKPRKKSNDFLKKLSHFYLFFLKITNITKGKNLPTFFRNKFITLPIILILIIVILYIYFFFTLKTTVVLTLNPKIEEQKQDVTFSSESTNVNEKIILAEIVETSLEGSSSTNATGKKETGTKAKGTITFYSRFTSKRTIPTGTILASSTGPEFTLDKAVEISSASADASASPVTANGNVTAKEIGKESNLPSGTKFNVENLAPSSIIAKNESAFSGGTKEEITIISKADTEKLLEEIIKNLEEKALQELMGKINIQEKILLPVVIDSTVEKQDFDKKIGDEASKLNLKATINFQGLSYSKKDLISFTKSLLEKEISDKMEIDENNIKVDVEDIKKKDKDTNEVSASLKIKAPLLPSLNKDELAKSVVNKSKEEAKNKLLEISQVVDVDINTSLPIPFLTNFLPRFSNNIEIVIKVNE